MPCIPELILITNFSFGLEQTRWSNTSAHTFLSTTISSTSRYVKLKVWKELRRHVLIWQTPWLNSTVQISPTSLQKLDLLLGFLTNCASFPVVHGLFEVSVQNENLSRHMNITDGIQLLNAYINYNGIGRVCKNRHLCSCVMGHNLWQGM